MMLSNGHTMKRNANSCSCILKLSKQLENNGFAKSCGEDINRILCHFFLVRLCFPRKLGKQFSISQSASPVTGATGSEKISSKFPKESVVCLFSSLPKSLSSIPPLARASFSGRLLCARCKSARLTLREKTDY